MERCYSRSEPGAQATGQGPALALGVRIGNSCLRKSGTRTYLPPVLAAEFATCESFGPSARVMGWSGRWGLWADPHRIRLVETTT